MAKKPRNKEQAWKAQKAAHNKPDWGKIAEFLRKQAIAYRMTGDAEMASYFKRWAQAIERNP